LDVGTEMGDMSALYASWGLGIFLVEPNPKAWPWIASTFEANHLKQTVHGWYVGMLGNPKQMQETNHLAVFGDGLMWPDDADGEMDEATGFYHLAEHMPVSPVTTIDDLDDQTNFHPTAITMDIEGGEFDALWGATVTLMNRRPKVWVSIHPEFMADQYHHTPEELHAFMAECGYDPVFLAIDHEHHWMFLPKEYGWHY
jgi:FkbM family methyltransferase